MKKFEFRNPNFKQVHYENEIFILSFNDYLYL